MNLVLHIEANTLKELKRQALAALDYVDTTPEVVGAGALTSPPSPQPLKAVPSESVSVPSSNPSPLVGLASGSKAPATRTRRTQAQIEADRQAKNNAPGVTAAQKVENSFKAADEQDAVSAPEDESDVSNISIGDLTGDVEAQPVDLKTAQDAVKALCKFMLPNEVLECLLRHGQKSVSLMTDDQRASFYAEAQNKIAESAK